VFWSFDEVIPRDNLGLTVLNLDLSRRKRSSEIEDGNNCVDSRRMSEREAYSYENVRYTVRSCWFSSDCCKMRAVTVFTGDWTSVPI